MKIALTGATGFLGRYLIDELTSGGHEVRAWHRPQSPVRERARVQWCTGQLGDAEATRRLVEGTDAVVHAAYFRQGPGFLGSEGEPVEFFDVNVLGSLRLLEAAKASGASRFVFVSSGTVHQRVLPDRPLDETHPLWPASLYGAYKASVETLIHAYGLSGELQAATVRPTSIYGLADPPEKSKWYDLVRDVAAGQRVDASGGSKEVHAGDVAAAVRLVLESDQPVAGETFNCSDRLISHMEVAEIAKRLSGSDAAIEGERKEVKNRMDTSKIERLGMRFGGTERLEATVAGLLDHLGARPT